jgi:cytochrome c-type biogenesis protein CcmE
MIVLNSQRHDPPITEVLPANASLDKHYKNYYIDEIYSFLNGDEMKLKIVIGVLVIVIAFAVLIFSGLKETAVYYYTISELRAKKDQPAGEGLRISGVVDPKSIEWNAEKIKLKFVLVEGTDSLQVEYQGPKPDQLADAQQVVAEGHLDGSGVFQAKKILLKCPSKYETKKG